MLLFICWQQFQGCMWGAEPGPEDFHQTFKQTGRVVLLLPFTRQSDAQGLHSPDSAVLKAINFSGIPDSSPSHVPMHSAVEWKTDFLPWSGWAARTWSQQWGWPCRRDQKFPSQPLDCSSAERETRHPSLQSPAVGDKGKMVRGETTGNGSTQGVELQSMDVRLWQHALLCLQKLGTKKKDADERMWGENS